MRKLYIFYRLVLFWALLQLSFFTLLQIFGVVAQGGAVSISSGLGLLLLFLSISALISATLAWYLGNLLRTQSIRTQVWALVIGLLVIALTYPPTFIYLD